MNFWTENEDFEQCVKIWQGIFFSLQIKEKKKKETEEQIREALKAIMKKDDVEEELRKALEGLYTQEPTVENVDESDENKKVE